MILGRLLGVIFLLLGFAALGRDVIASISKGELDILPLGRFWFALDAGSLNGLQAGIERYLSVWLWENVMAPLLHGPLFLFGLVPGLLLLFICRRRSKDGGERRVFRRRS